MDDKNPAESNEAEQAAAQGAPELGSTAESEDAIVDGNNTDTKDLKNEAAKPALQLISSRPTPVKFVEKDDEDEPWLKPDDLNEHVDEPGDPDGVWAADQQKNVQERHPEPEPVAIAARKRHHPIRTFFIIVIVIIGLAYGAYWGGGKLADRKNQPSQNTVQTNTKPKLSKPMAATTTPYSSNNFSVGFNYPSTWKVSDMTAKLTVVSPVTQLTQIDGQKVSLHIIMTIQNTQQTIPNYPANGAVAELDSDKLTYSQPTNVQRAQTYLSYLGYKKTNGLDALYITGDNGYMQGQVVPESDVLLGDPLVSVSFATCASSDCSAGTVTPVTLLASQWKATDSSKAVATMLESIQFD